MLVGCLHYVHKNKIDIPEALTRPGSIVQKYELSPGYLVWIDNAGYCDSRFPDHSQEYHVDAYDMILAMYTKGMT